MWPISHFLYNYLIFEDTLTEVWSTEPLLQFYMVLNLQQEQHIQDAIVQCGITVQAYSIPYIFLMGTKLCRKCDEIRKKIKSRPTIQYHSDIRLSFIIRRPVFFIMKN